MTYTEEGSNPNYNTIQINNYDVVLLSAYHKLKQEDLGNFLDNCIKNGVNVVQIFWNNSSSDSGFPKGHF